MKSYKDIMKDIIEEYDYEYKLKVYEWVTHIEERIKEMVKNDDDKSNAFMNGVFFEVDNLNKLEVRMVLFELKECDWPHSASYNDKTKKWEITVYT